jgi:hypothetical protein
MADWVWRPKKALFASKHMAGRSARIFDANRHQSMPCRDEATVAANVFVWPDSTRGGGADLATLVTNEDASHTTQPACRPHPTMSWEGDAIHRVIVRRMTPISSSFRISSPGMSVA